MKDINKTVIVTSLDCRIVLRFFLAPSLYSTKVQSNAGLFAIWLAPRDKECLYEITGCISLSMMPVRNLENQLSNANGSMSIGGSGEEN